MTTETILLLSVIIAGLYMAWNIGANDVANAMGTSVGSGSLTLKEAVILAAILEFCGAYFFGSHVSETLQKGIVDTSVFTPNPQLLVIGMLSALISAGVWLQIASYFGWPVSTTHAIVGAVVGFGAAAGGMEAIHWDNMGFIVSSWVVSPITGGVMSYVIFSLIRSKVFYTFHPVYEAKRITPIIVFFFIMTLSLIMISQGLKNLDLEFSIAESMGISVVMGLIGSFVSYLLVRRIKVGEVVESRPKYGSDVAYSIEKAKKHLQKVALATTGELQQNASSLFNEVNGLSKSFKQKIETEVSSSEYTRVEQIFGYLQILSASMMAFAHGANDVANAIGPMAAAINVLETGVVGLLAPIPAWILALGGAGIVFGLATWGWRVIETIGKKITELTPTRGFSAEFGAATTVLIASGLGMPISTTHTLVGAVIGVGLAGGIGALNLSTTRDIVISWIVTVPVGAVIAVIFFYGIQFLIG